jgi:hypothetical protein
VRLVGLLNERLIARALDITCINANVVEDSCKVWAGGSRGITWILPQSTFNPAATTKKS